MTDTTQQHIDVREEDGVSVVTLRDARILDDATISQVGQELFDLVDVENRKKLLLCFGRVEFLSSAALGKLITLRRKVDDVNGHLGLCEIRSETFEVFRVAKLDTFFDIHDHVSAALASF